MTFAKTDSLAAWLSEPFVRFAAIESSSALLLLLASAAALAAANSPLGPAWQAFWQTPLSLSLGESFRLSLPLVGWVNDGLMAIFFFLIGLEIKRELLSASSPRSGGGPCAGPPPARGPGLTGTCPVIVRLIPSIISMICQNLEPLTRLRPRTYPASHASRDV